MLSFWKFSAYNWIMQENLYLFSWTLAKYLKLSGNGDMLVMFMAPSHIWWLIKYSGCTSTLLYSIINNVPETSFFSPIIYFSYLIYYLMISLYFSTRPQSCTIDLWVGFRCSVYNVIFLPINIIKNSLRVSMILSIYFSIVVCLF